jgi:molybdopterin molybdotransferase
VLHSGQTITPLAIAVLASFGLESVAVIPRPALAIVTTGAELVPPGGRPGPGRIRDSNGPMLRAMARELGIEPPPQLHADDRIEAILSALDATAEADLVLVTGGVSAGKYDLVPDALAAYGARQVFHRVSQKPGRPLLLARRGSQVIFGLPGNPLSCHFCFHRYVSAAVGQMQGRAAPVEPPRGRLAAAAEPRPTRTHFIPARAEHVAPAGAAPDQWQLDPLPAASSADVFTCSRANCYLEAPPGRAPIPAGQVLPFTWLAGSPTA